MFWDKDRQDAAIANNHSKIVEGMANKRTLLAILWVSMSLNLAVWIIVLLFPSNIYRIFELIFNISDKLFLAIMGIPFVLSIFFAYSLFRLKFPDIEEQNLDSEMLSSYAYQSNSIKRWRVWILSTSFGVVNVFLLILTDMILHH